MLEGTLAPVPALSTSNQSSEEQPSKKKFGWASLGMTGNERFTASNGLNDSYHPTLAEEDSIEIAHQFL